METAIYGRIALSPNHVFSLKPGNVAVHHGSNLKVKLAELGLKCVICGLGVLAAVLVATDTQVRQIFSIQKESQFTDMKALIFLVTANAIAAAYSFVQGVRCVVGIVRGTLLFNKPLAWAIFSGDQETLVPQLLELVSFQHIDMLMTFVKTCIFVQLKLPSLFPFDFFLSSSILLLSLNGWELKNYYFFLKYLHIVSRTTCKSDCFKEG